jgi:hypothetical protein
MSVLDVGGQAADGYVESRLEALEWLFLSLGLFAGTPRPPKYTTPRALESRQPFLYRPLDLVADARRLPHQPVQGGAGQDQ